MKLLKLNFKGFRNLEDGFIEPGEKVNVIYGENAQGKTNLLEAVWVLCGAHSFRGAKDSELVGFNSEKARLYAEFYSQNRVQNVHINFYPTQNKKMCIRDSSYSDSFLNQNFTFSEQIMNL